MANPTPNDWGSGDVKLPACPNEVVKDNADTSFEEPADHRVGASDAPSLDSNAYLAERSFYSVPASACSTRARISFTPCTGRTLDDRFD